VKLEQCRYCSFQSEHFWPVVEHERDAHRAERRARLCLRLSQIMLYALLASFFGVPLMDYVMKFWGIGAR
jgi:hypothetical protein